MSRVIVKLFYIVFIARQNMVIVPSYVKHSSFLHTHCPHFIGFDGELCMFLRIREVLPQAQWHHKSVKY